MTYTRTITIVIIFLITLFLTGFASHSERIKPNKPFSQFPLTIDKWQGRSGELDQEVYNILGVEDYILANYQKNSGENVNLYVGFYQSQKEGDIIHSPKNCMPGAGWKIIQTSLVQIALDPEKKETRVIKLLLQKGIEKQVVLYWFQSRGRIIASEYMQKIWLVIDSVTKQRTDGSFVRLISPVVKSEEITLETLKAFAIKIYPYLNEHIPVMNSKLNTPVLAKVIIIAAAFSLLYHHTISKLISDWATDPNFSHGFLVPFVALYMVWFKKNEIALIPSSPSSTGLFVILLGMLIHIAGNVGAELFLMRFSLVVTISGIIIYGFGYKVFKAVLVPVAYLVIMIPIPAILWNKVAFPLQLFAASLSSEFIQLLGIPIFREGNILHLANTSLEVVDACSGLRSLTSLLALTGAFAFLAPLSSFKKWILFFSAIPIAVAVNVIRLTITGAMAAWIGPETAHGFLHDMSGLIIFGAALILVYIVYTIEMKFEN